MSIRKIILEAYARHSQKPFAWDQRNDCLGFAAECAQAILGHDPILILRGTYSGEMSARRVMILNGWKDMGDVAAAFFPEIPVSQVQSGDWVQIVNKDGTDVVGVVIGDRAAAKTKEGTGQALMSQVRRAFAVVPR